MTFHFTLYQSIKIQFSQIQAFFGQATVINPKVRLTYKILILEMIFFKPCHSHNICFRLKNLEPASSTSTLHLMKKKRTVTSAKIRNGGRRSRLVWSNIFRTRIGDKFDKIFQNILPRQVDDLQQTLNSLGLEEDRRQVERKQSAHKLKI